MRIRWTPAAAADLQRISDYEEVTRELLFPPLPYIAVCRVKEQCIEVVRIITALKIGADYRYGGDRCGAGTPGRCL